MGVLLGMLSLLVSVLFVVIRFAVKKRQLQRSSWDGILSRVEEVDIAGLQAIAALWLNPDKNQLSIGPGAMWKTVGGLRGLERLLKNADAMLTLAMFTEQWHSPDGRIISEFMRRDAARLKKTVLLAEISLIFGFGRIKAPFALQEAIATYIQMRGRLFGLYGVAHVGRIPLLEASL